MSQYRQSRLYLDYDNDGHYLSFSERALKTCDENGTWFKKEGHAWTDYRPCLDKEVRTSEIILDWT